MLLWPPTIAGACRKDEPEIALGAGEFPFSQRVHHDRRQRDRPLAGFRLGFADGAVAVRALSDVKLSLLKVDVGPAQPTKLGSPQAGEDRRQQKSAASGP